MRPLILLCAGLTAAAIMASSVAAAESCALKQIASLALTDDGRRLLVPVTVADKPLNFVLQLADANSGIAASAAANLSLSKRTMPIRLKPRVDGKEVTTLISVPTLQLDRLTARDFKLFEISSTGEADGILGLDILSANDLDLDLAHDRANLFSRDHCTGKVVYWTAPAGAIAEIPMEIGDAATIHVQMTLDGHTLDVGIGTSGRSFMGMNVAHRVFGIDEQSPGLQKTGTDPHGDPLYRYPFHEIDAQGLKIENPDIVIGGKVSDPECNTRGHPVLHSAGEETYCYGGADLRLGLSVLRKLHLFFAFGERMLYATAA